MARRSLGSLTLDLVARIGGFQRGMDQAARIADTRARSIDRALGRAGRAVTGLFAGISAGLVVRKIVEATAAQETALAELRSALEATDHAAGFTEKQLSDFATTLQRQTRFGDEAILDLQTTLLRFTNVVGEEFTRATELSLDLATALRTDPVSAAKLLGQALENPVRGISRLRKAGVELDEDQVQLVKRLQEAGSAAEAQGVLLDALSTIQGRAAASADTLGGALDQVKNAFGDLFEASTEGSEAAKEALQELRDELTDPQTKQAAERLSTAVITLFGNIAEYGAEAINIVHFLGEELARLTVGPALDDAIGIQRAIDQVEEIRRTLAASPLERLRFFGRDGIVEWYSDAELEAELARLRRMLRSAEPFAPVLGADGRPVPGETRRGAGGGGGDGEDAQESAFAKLKENLEQQVALYGAVGEAAKLRYQVENDLIEGLTDAQGQQLIALAEQLDAKIAAGELAKQQAEAEQALRQAYDDQATSLGEQIALNGELTELEKVRYEIAYGALQGINEEEAKRLEALAAARDAQLQQNEDLDRARQIYEETLTPLERYIEQLEEIVRLRDAGAFDELGDPAAIAAEAAAAAADEYKHATEEITTFHQRAKENIQDVLANFLEDPISRGFDGLLQDFGEMLSQMAAQAIAADIAGKIFGAAGSGGSGGGLASQFGNFLTSLFTRDAGGRGTPGEAYVIGTGAQPELFVPDTPGTFVPNVDRMRPVTVENRFTIHAPTGTVSRATQQQIAAAAGRGVAESMRRNN